MLNTYSNIINELPFAAAIFEKKVHWKPVHQNKLYLQLFGKREVSIDYLLDNDASNMIIPNHTKEIFQLIDVSIRRLDDDKYLVLFNKVNVDIYSGLRKLNTFFFEYIPSLNRSFLIVPNDILPYQAYITDDYFESFRNYSPVHPSDVENYINMFKSFINNKKLNEVIDLRFSVDGIYVWYRTRLTKIYSNGVVIQISCTMEYMIQSLENKEKYEYLLGSNKEQLKKYASQTVIDLTNDKVIEISDGLPSNLKDMPINQLNLFLQKHTSTLSAHQLYTCEELLQLFSDGTEYVSAIIRVIEQKNTYELNISYNITRDTATCNILCIMSAEDITAKYAYRKISRYLASDFFESILLVDIHNQTYYTYNKECKSFKFFNNFDSHIDNVLTKKYSIKNKPPQCFKISYLKEQLSVKRPYVETYNMFSKTTNMHYTYRIIADYLDNDKILILKIDDTEIRKKELRYEKDLHSALYDAKKADKAKSKFINNMSQDLRIPLNTIIDISAASLNNNNSHEYMNSVKTIKESSRYILNSINDILNMSQLDSDNVVIKKENYYLKEFINNTASIVRPLIAAKNLDFFIDYSGIQCEYQSFDIVHTQQILINLFNNAVKFTETGYVKWKIRIIMENNIQYVEHTVIDTGIGMSPETIDNIFNCFAKFDENDIIYQGIGLGLTITKKLVNLLNGVIKVNSKPDIGSVFQVLIPIDPVYITSEYSRETALAISKNNLAGKNILLVVRNDTDAAIISSIFRNYKINVVRTKDRNDAVKKFSDYFDFVLTDIEMPQTDSIKTAKIIADLTDKDIPIIGLCSGNCSNQKIQITPNVIKDLLYKPYDFEYLFITLNKYS